MQLNSKNIQNKGLVGLLGCVWVAGLLLAGSDSPYLPWLNLAGTLVFIGASLWLGRVLPRLDVTGKNSLVSPAVPGRGLDRPTSGKPKDRVSPPCLGGLVQIQGILAHMNKNSSVHLS